MLGVFFLWEQGGGVVAGLFFQIISSDRTGLMKVVYRDNIVFFFNKKKKIKTNQNITFPFLHVLGSVSAYLYLHFDTAIFSICLFILLKDMRASVI